MLLKRFTDFILKSPLHLWSTAFLITFVPLLGSVSIIMVGFITLIKGTREGLILLVVALMPLAISLYYGAPTPANSFGPNDVLLCYMFINVLTWMFAALLRQYGGWSLLIELAGLLGVISIVVVYRINPDIQNWWQLHLNTYITGVLNAASDSQAPADTVKDMATSLKPVATSSLVVIVICWALLQVLLARWWQAALYNRGGLRKELCNIRLSVAAGIVSFIVALLLFTGSPVVVEIATVIICMYVLAGFSVLHVLLTSVKRGWLWSTLVYAGMIVLPLGMGLVGVLGLVDTFFDCRKWVTQKQI